MRFSGRVTPSSPPAQATAPSRWRPPLRWVIAAAGATLLVLATALVLTPWRQWLPEIRQFAADAMGTLRSAGPGAFYSAAVVLPAVGVPVAPFFLGGAALFGPWIGFAGGLAAFVGCITLSHALAVGVLRRPLTAIVARLGWTVPAIPPASRRDMILLIRITPGLPFPVQNYLLSLGGVPLLPNILWSLPVFTLYLAAFCFLGGSLFSGRFGTAALGVALLIVAILAVRLLRRRRTSPPVPTP